MKPSSQIFMEIFDRLSERFGPLHWWPAETPFEVCVGAILTQNTAWTNVEKAITALRQGDIMTPADIRDIEPRELAQLIRPAGYFNVKSQRLKDFVAWLFLHYDGSLKRMFTCEWLTLRTDLLQVRGIGPETADSILLYAGYKPSFVVDAYTRRLFHRLGFLPEDAGYDATRSMFMDKLPSDVQLFNEYHAQIVEQCKQFCRKNHSVRAVHCRASADLHLSENLPVASLINLLAKKMAQDYKQDMRGPVGPHLPW